MKLKTHHKKALPFIILTLATILSFQNCANGDFAIDTKPVVTSTGEIVADQPLPSNPGTTPNPTPTPHPEPTPMPPNSDYRLVPKTLLKRTNIEVDILVVGDNSASMKYEQESMSTKFPSFISNLATLDWRLGIITTNTRGRSDDQPLSKGNLVPFSSTTGSCGSKVYIEKSLSNANDCFKNTIQMGANPKDENGLSTGDERGIYASNLAISKNKENWLRTNSHLAILVLSDEDENSNGTDLENLDQPSSLADTIKNKFGAQKSFSFHAITIKDTACLASQRLDQDPYFPIPETNTTISQVYISAVNMYKGIVGSVCATDYSSQLSDIGKNIQTKVGSLELECAPHIDDSHKVKISINNVDVTSEIQFHTSENILILEEEVESGSDIKVEYTCKELIQ